jgi:hypothetical protein
MTAPIATLKRADAVSKRNEEQTTAFGEFDALLKENRAQPFSGCTGREGLSQLPLSIAICHDSLQFCTSKDR